MFYVEFLRGCVTDLSLADLEKICREIDEEASIMATGSKGLVIVKFPKVHPTVLSLSKKFPEAFSIHALVDEDDCPVMLVQF